MHQPKKFDREWILANPSLEKVYHKLWVLAEEFAVLGEIDTVKGLISLLLCDTTSEWQRRQIGQFEPYFAAANIWPDEILEKDRTRAIFDKTATKHGLETSDRDDLQIYKGQLKLEINEAKKYESSVGKFTEALCTAVKMASTETSDMEELQNDPKVQEVLGYVAENLYKSRLIKRLAGHHELSGLLSTGALARKVPVDKDKLKNLGKEVIETFTERFTNGRKPHEMESKTMKEVLVEIESNAKVKSVGHWQEMEEEPPETLFVLPPVTDKQISSLEKRLGVTLPADYKEFLKISNGFGQPWNGFHPDPPLFGVEDVKWSDPLFGLYYVNFHDNISGVLELELPKRSDWPNSGPTIEIGRDDVLGTLLVTPDRVKQVLDAYKQAMDGTSTSEDDKKQVMKVIEAKYGSFEEMQKLEWAVIGMHDSEQLPFGTFRQFLEEQLWRSMGVGFPDENTKEVGSLAYSCLSDDP
ncbi:hypothetical protein F53441_10877 [Fusarium austroafricanum]|uniref:Knr4/Smi1-like domain-containing protein n=1 Tax=Fusarium austroafricanum TaxID=2364996 RepID=A0A8H4K9F9_9HYPO|nr:hypothetical protein F53441_10877 [Fusarium austroafricanum]